MREGVIESDDVDTIETTEEELDEEYDLYESDEREDDNEEDDTKNDVLSSKYAPHLLVNKASGVIDEHQLFVNRPSSGGLYIKHLEAVGEQMVSNKRRLEPEQYDGHQEYLPHVQHYVAGMQVTAVQQNEGHLDQKQQYDERDQQHPASHQHYVQHTQQRNIQDLQEGHELYGSQEDITEGGNQYEVHQHVQNGHHVQYGSQEHIQQSGHHHQQQHMAKNGHHQVAHVHGQQELAAGRQQVTQDHQQAAPGHQEAGHQEAAHQEAAHQEAAHQEAAHQDRPRIISTNYTIPVQQVVQPEHAHQSSFPNNVPTHGYQPGHQNGHRPVSHDPNEHNLKSRHHRHVSQQQTVQYEPQQGADQTHKSQNRQTYTAEDYAYIPANSILRSDGTVDPRYISLFASGYLMVLRSQAPWLGGEDQQEVVHILGVPIAPEGQYMVFIPALGYEQVVPGSSISDNPNDSYAANPTTFLVLLSGRNYIGTKISMIDSSYHQSQNQQQQQQERNAKIGTALQPSTYYGRIPHTLSLFGIPVLKDQTYYIYVPQFNNEYSVTGEALSPNPDDQHSLYVTIYRRRYKGTAIRPVFPELIPRNIKGEQAEIPPIIYNRYENPRGKSSDDRGKLIIYGVTVEVGDKYYAYVPVLKTEYIVYGAAVQLNPNDATTILVVLNNTRMVATGLRPADDLDEPPEQKLPHEPTRHTLLAFGVPVNPSSTYLVTIPELGTEHAVYGNSIFPNANDPNSIVVNINGVLHIATSCKLADAKSDKEGKAVNTGETMELRGIITAFGIPIVPTENYLVYIPDLKGEYLVEGASIHSNPKNEMTILAIMDNAKFVCTSLRRLEEQIVLPKFPIGTVLQSSLKEHQLGSNGSSNSESTGSDFEKKRQKRPSVGRMRVKQLSEGLKLDLSLSSNEEKIVTVDPAEIVTEEVTEQIEKMDLNKDPIFVLNGVSIYEEKFYQITTNGVKSIVSGKSFKRQKGRPSTFTVNVNNNEEKSTSCSNILELLNAKEKGNKLAIPSTISAFDVFQSQMELDKI